MRPIWQHSGIFEKVPVRKATILKRKITPLLMISMLVLFTSFRQKEDLSQNDLSFKTIPVRWDEAIPLGNGIIGALVWKKGEQLRFSLDRTDLWDLRPVENLSKPEFSYQWVKKQVDNDNYAKVQALFDQPYDQMPAPSKIPGAALEFNINQLGDVKETRLQIKDASATIKWVNGAELETFVHANQQQGWFRFTGVDNSFRPEIIPPEYQNTTNDSETNPVTGQDLQRLGYEQGQVMEAPQLLVYRQKGWNGFAYEVAVKWENNNGTCTGVWSISSTLSESKGEKRASNVVSVEKILPAYKRAYISHLSWWVSYWGKSTVNLPDTVLQKQYYLEMYKFGSVAKPDAPPISLQAVWTADNGKLPPWKGDFHHDLNTQLSYWPSYAGNHLDLEIGFVDWLWENRETFKAYTKTYFGTNGINVPGVTTLTGEPMGGWIQYSFGPTVGAWLAHHFYLHWIYSGDKEFLTNRAYPWIKDVAVYFEEISERDTFGKRKLPISSSPEIRNNDREAWFLETTNFDLALIRWTFQKAAELARETGEVQEAEKWERILSEWPELAISGEKGGLNIAPNVKYASSHRHFSHLLGWHPLGLIDWSNGLGDQEIIRNTLNDLEEVGSDWWVGYSFSWLANLYARAKMGDKAAETLRVFAENFCLPNSFHVNGEQNDKGLTNFKYRPFTLEGNFAFASGVQEMILQSHSGVIEIFPATPQSWQEVSFEKLRARGAVLVSAKREKENSIIVQLQSLNGGLVKMKNPFKDKGFKTKKENIKVKEDILEIYLEPNEIVVLLSD